MLTARGQLPEVANIFTAGPPKGGSQFMKQLFSHPIVAAHHGLFMLPEINYQAHPEWGVPPGTYVPGLHMSWPEFQRMPHKHTRRIIYMFRDPREVFVSGYFSAVGVHRPIKGIEEFRDKLRAMPREEGLLELIRDPVSNARIKEMATWVDVEDPDVLKFWLEELSTTPETVVPRMLEHCGVKLSEDELATVLKDTSRESLQAKDLAKRPEGSESHYRKNRLGFRDLFGPEHYAAVEEVSPGLAKRLGYED